MLLFNSECHFEVLPAYCFYFNCNKSRSKTYELEISRKKSHGSWKHKNKKDEFGNGATKAQGTRDT